MFLSLCLLFIYCCTLAIARAGEVLILEKGKESIRGILPDAWRELTIEERKVYLQQQDNLLQSAGTLLSAFQRQSDSAAAAPVLFVFHASADQRVPEEQRQKMYFWFEKNREIVQQVALTNVKNMSLENIEYLHDRDTIIFETSVTIQGRQMDGVSGIVFLDKGYLNIIGYDIDGKKCCRQEFYSFIKTLSVPEAFKYPSERYALPNLSWFVAHWQQVSGAFLFLFVYGLVFLRKERK